MGTVVIVLIIVIDLSLLFLPLSRGFKSISSLVSGEGQVTKGRGGRVGIMITLYTIV